MAIFPKKIADHLWENLAIRQRPVWGRESGVMTGHQCAGNDQEKSRASDDKREAMDPFAHLTSRDSQSPIAELLFFNRQSEIGNRKSKSVMTHDRNFDGRHHFQTWSPRSSCTFAEREVSFRRAIRSHRDLHCFFRSGSATFMPRGNGVSSRRYTLDGECAVFGANREERVL